VFVPKFGIEGPVYLTPRSDSSSKGSSGKAGSSSSAAVEEGAFVLDEKKQTVVSRCVRACLRMLVCVCVWLGGGRESTHCI
jgi:hypothetical protein